MNSATTTPKPATSAPTTTKQLESSPIYIKFLSFAFYIIQILTVLCSWRVYFLFVDNSSGGDEKQEKKLTFKEKVQHNFVCLFTDIFYLIMLAITCTLFFWRSIDTLTQLKKSDSSSKYKQIIWNQFTGGFIEFSSFMVLLLLKWPVIFKVFWNKGTEKEDKSTWSQIFMREFSKETINKERGGDISATMPKAPATKTTNFKGNGKPSNGDSKSRTLSDDEWRHAFRRDLQNIGFEFDSTTGDVTKFPPTEVMEQYQKSSEFRELVLSAGSNKANNPDPIIKEYEEHKKQEEKDKQAQDALKEQDEKEKQQEQEQQPQEQPHKVLLTTTTTTTTTTKSGGGKKGKKGKKGKQN